MTLIGPTPVRSASAARSEPTRDPGGTISGKIFTGNPNFCNSSVAHARFLGFTHWLVVAMVNSDARVPERQKFKKSGVIRSVDAASAAVELNVMERDGFSAADDVCEYVQ